MHSSRLLLAGLFSLVAAFGSVSLAQLLTTGAGQATTSVVSTYTGIGNIATFNAFWSCTYAYSRTVAQAGSVLCDLRRQSDGDTCSVSTNINGLGDFTVATPCNGGTQTITAWGGTSTAIAVGTVAAGVLTITSITSGTITLHSTVVGSWNGAGSAALEGGVYISSFGTGSGGTGTYNTNSNITQANSQTFYFFDNMTVTKIYDQTAGLACGGASCDWTASTAVRRPIMSLNACNNLPCAVFPFTNTKNTCMASSNNFTPNATEDSLQLVARSDTSSQTDIMFSESGATNSNRISKNTTANKWQLNAALDNTNATDGVLHSMTAHAKSGTNAADLQIDGNFTTGSQHQTTAGTPFFGMGCASSAAVANHYFGEGAIASSNQSGSENSQQTNMKTRWSTP